MIRFKCPKCQKAMGVDDSKAGALGMCPACKATFRIPMPASVVPVRPAPAPAPEPSPSDDATRIVSIQRPASAPPVAPAPPPVPAPSYGNDALTYAVELEPEAPGPARKSAPSMAKEFEPDDVDEDEYAPRRRRRRWGGPGGVWTGDLVPGISNFALIMVVLGLGWVLLSGLTLVFAPAGLLLVGIGCLICFVTNVWMIKIAFEDGTGTGLSYLFIPFYSLMFIFANLDRCGVPLLINLVGLGYILAGWFGVAIRGG